MSGLAARKGPGDGLQPERTALAWSRTSLAVLGNGALLLVRELHSFPGTLRLVPASLAVAVALLTYVVGIRRRRLLHKHPLPDRIAARREIHIVGVAIVALIIATALMLPV